MTFLDQKRPDMQTWTDERVELLKKLWADGLSASQIAGELGGITRNAVIGKVHRLGLSGRAKAPSSSVPRQRKPRAPTMFRAPRPMMRGNTALAAQPNYDYDAEPEPQYDREHHPDRAALHDCSNSTPKNATGRSAIRASRTSISAAARPTPARPTAAITGASPISRRQRGATGGRHASDRA